MGGVSPGDNREGRSRDRFPKHCRPFYQLLFVLEDIFMVPSIYYLSLT